uniref:G_PROTEIN_RECEP_F1_2 domain-containing protein n=1 Tax=Haemonchus contortus TaxID=6289 RepID=A0A7I4YPI9_HAECO
MAQDILHTVCEGALASTYVFVLFIIITSKVKTFKNPFYVLFVATGIADVFSIMTSCFHRLNRQIGLGPEFANVVVIAVLVSGTSFLTHMIGNMLLTLNRYSALCLMKKYDKIWTRRNVWIMILVQYIVAFGAYSHNIGVNVLYSDNGDGRYVFTGIDPAVSWRNRFVFLIGSFVYAVMSVSFNTRLFIEWRRLSRFNNDSRISGHEKGLLFYTALVFVSTMLMCLQQITKVIGNLTGNVGLDTWATMQVSEELSYLSPSPKRNKGDNTSTSHARMI